MGSTADKTCSTAGFFFLDLRPVSEPLRRAASIKRAYDPPWGNSFFFSEVRSRRQKIWKWVWEPTTIQAGRVINPYRTEWLFRSRYFVSVHAFFCNRLESIPGNRIYSGQTRFQVEVTEKKIFAYKIFPIWGRDPEKSTWAHGCQISSPAQILRNPPYGMFLRSPLSPLTTWFGPGDLLVAMGWSAIWPIFRFFLLFFKVE